MTIKPGKTFLLYSRFKKGQNSRYIYCGIVTIKGRQYRLLSCLDKRFYNPVENGYIKERKERIVWKGDFPDLAKKHLERFKSYPEDQQEIILKHLTPPKDRKRKGFG